TVLVRRPDGSFKNRARTLIVESRATASPKPLEWAHNREYRRLADAAAAGHRRIWNGRACGWGPQQAAHIHVEVHPDAPGVDAQNLNGERVLVENRNKSATLRLGGWWVRDASPYRYVFPRGTSVPAGRTLVLRSGCGNRTALTHYWCSPVPRFLNASFDERALGDGAYLVDRDGDIRRRHLYP
ncbi:MAG: lamin tail domain-containing protein, partial [Micromonosporaceae bacterium]